MEYSASDYKKGQPRWCPGCGDHSFLASMQKAMAEIGVPPYETAVISGIGCSSRLPYYVSTYAMQTIHGRAAAVATGAKVVNPKLAIWQISGDGDGLAIGGNHFIHAMRRNIDLNMILLNNRIYGLTKGQYSPTSPRGFVSKSSPYGTVEDPFRPAELCFGARGRFFARSVASDSAETVKILKAAYNEYGLVQEGFGLKVVEIGKDGYTIDNILVHDSHTPDNTLQLKLAMMDNEHGFPVALGVFRDVEAPTYDQAVNDQIEEVKEKKKYHNFTELLETNDIWEVK